MENEIVYHSKDINFSIHVSVHISFFNSDLKISDFCFPWRCIWSDTERSSMTTELREILAYLAEGLLVSASRLHSIKSKKRDTVISQQRCSLSFPWKLHGSNCGNKRDPREKNEPVRLSHWFAVEISVNSRHCLASLSFCPHGGIKIFHVLDSFGRYKFWFETKKTQSTTMNTLRGNELYISLHIVTLHLSRHRTFNNTPKYRSTNTNREPNAAYVRMYIDCRYVGRDCIGICYSVLVFVIRCWYLYSCLHQCVRASMYMRSFDCAHSRRETIPPSSVHPFPDIPCSPFFSLSISLSFLPSLLLLPLWPFTWHPDALRSSSDSLFSFS